MPAGNVEISGGTCAFFCAGLVGRVNFEMCEEVQYVGLELVFLVGR